MAPQQQSLARFFTNGGASLKKKTAGTTNGGTTNGGTTPSTTSKKRARSPSPPSSPKKRSRSSSPPPTAKRVKIIPETVVKVGDSEIHGDTDSDNVPDTSSQLDEAKELIKLSEQHKSVAPAVVGSKIPYATLTSIFAQIGDESSRLKMTSILSQFFEEILSINSIDMLIKIVYLVINRLGPDYEPGLELGLGETLLIKAISEGYGRSLSKVRADYKDAGDLGLVAQRSRSGQPTMFKPKPLDVEVVFDNLTAIAKSTGKESQSKKIGIINKMLTACDPKSHEAKFLIRSLEGKLRIGLAEKTVLTALAQAFVNHEAKEKRVHADQLSKAEDIIREGFSQIPNYEVLIRTCSQYGIFKLLDHIKLTPGIPVKPMLAKPTKSIGEVLDRFQNEEFTCEYKYDGERAQVHVLPDSSVRIYSRNSEDMSERYPDLISIITEFSKKQDLTSMILDCEAVAWDRVQNKILPFQVLSTRKRKDVTEKDITVHICLFAFDLIYYNGESLITKSLAERRSIMYENFSIIEGQFQFATKKDSSNLDELQLFLDQSVKDACEGLMVKMLNGQDSYYEPSKRSRNWLKLKKDYLAGVGDSLDLVVIGAYNGRGKRTGTYGGFLLASYNQDSGELETTCKIGTGFSDEDLTNLYNKLHPTEIPRPRPHFVYDSSAVPDVWFEPSLLFEVLTADLSLSPIYKAGHTEYGKGISLRFPRFLRIRDDKGIEDGTSSTEVAEFYERQANLN
ncbi:DNA ligase 1 [Spathaspora sp. JA1]|nr:DNA ligase 1 [Spathaspora sp. JA1]